MKVLRQHSAELSQCRAYRFQPLGEVFSKQYIYPCSPERSLILHFASRWVFIFVVERLVVLGSIIISLGAKVNGSLKAGLCYDFETRISHGGKF